MAAISQDTVRYIAYAALNVMIAREVNSIAVDPYMDEPFHIPQAQAYCDGKWDVWDPKITTPPGLYLLSVLFKRVFLFKCTVGVLRFTNILMSLSLPPLISQLLARLRRDRPPASFLEPTTESLIISLFPVAWFFSFLYYTETGSLILVLACLLASVQNQHVLASVLGLLSCTFRQTNIVWVVYAMGVGSLKALHRIPPPGTAQSGHRLLYDPPARSTTFFDAVRSVVSLPAAVLSVKKVIAPYTTVGLAFAAFMVWNGGIVLGDKSNHIPQLHVPQLYYFIGFSTILGLPTLLTGPGGPTYLIRETARLLVSTRRRIIVNTIITALIVVTIHLFTIHHPFLLSDNRHYTFYVWKRVFRSHPVGAYLLAPGYLVCYYAWFVRLYSPPPPPPPQRSGTGNGNLPNGGGAGGVPVRRSYALPPSMSLLHALLLPICLIPALLPTPLLEPRYFLVPYFLLRLQVDDHAIGGAQSTSTSTGLGATRGVLLEGAWYAVINWATMSVFLYKERPGVGRFMW